MKVAIAVFEGVHMLDLTGPAQIFYEGIKMGSDIQVEFISTSLDKMTYISSAGLSFTVTREFQRIELSEGDIIIVPGLDYQLISDELFLNSIRPFIVWLKEQNAKGVRICSVCTGAFILGEAEIIKDKSCTTHWRYCDRLIEKYPGIKIHKKRLFVEDGNIYTTAGMSSGIDLSLYLI
ncbi:MAG: DJ-1/PfpI family protein, partial [Balneola sp.]